MNFALSGFCEEKVIFILLRYLIDYKSLQKEVDELRKENSRIKNDGELQVEEFKGSLGFYKRFAEICQMDKGEYERAKDLFSQVLELREQLLEENKDNKKQQLDVGIALYKHGELALAQQQPEEAEEYFREALEIWGELLEKATTYEHERLFAVTGSGLGKTLLQQGRHHEALRYFQQSHGVYEKMAAKGQAVGVQSLLGMSFHHLALTSHADGELNECNDYLEKALGILSEVVRVTTSLHYKHIFMSTWEMGQKHLTSENMIAWRGEYEKCSTFPQFNNVNTYLCDLTWGSGF